MLGSLGDWLGSVGLSTGIVFEFKIIECNGKRKLALAHCTRTLARARKREGDARFAPRKLALASDRTLSHKGDGGARSGPRKRLPR